MVGLLAIAHALVKYLIPGGGGKEKYGYILK